MREKQSCGTELTEECYNKLHIRDVLIIKALVITYRKSIRQYGDTDRCRDDLYFYQRERES